MSIEDVNEQIERSAIHEGGELIPSVKTIVAGIGVAVDNADPENPIVSAVLGLGQLKLISAIIDFSTNDPQILSTVPEGVRRIFVGVVLRSTGDDLNPLSDGETSVMLGALPLFAAIPISVFNSDIRSDDISVSAFFGGNGVDWNLPVKTPIGVAGDNITVTFPGTVAAVTAGIDFICYDIEVPAE